MRMMKGIVLFLSFVAIFTLLLEGRTIAQASDTSTLEDSVILAIDLNCPIQLKGPTKVIQYPNGSSSLGYTIQNTSGSDVQSFVVQELNWFGTGGYRNRYDVRKSETFGSGATYSTLSHDETEPLNRDRKILGKSITKKPLQIWVVIVTYVVFSDGTKYDASGKLRFLEKYIDGLSVNSKMTDEDARLNEQHLSEFVRSKLFSGH